MRVGCAGAGSDRTNDSLTQKKQYSDEQIWNLKHKAQREEHSDLNLRNR